MGKKRYKVSAPRFIAIIAGLIVLIAIIIIVSVAKAGKPDTDAIVMPSQVVGEVTPTPEASSLPTSSASPTVPPTSTPSPSLPPTVPPTSVPTPTPVPTPSPTPGLKKDPKALSKPTKAMKKNAASGVLTGNNVNLRQGPSTSTPIVATNLKNKAELTVYTLSGNFYFVKVNKLNKYGYIAKQYVKLTSDFGSSSTATPKAATGTPPAGASEGTVTASKVALRAEASKDSKCIAEYSKGTKVFVLSKSKDFYYVQIAGTGKTGYIYASYIKISNK